MKDSSTLILRGVPNFREVGGFSSDYGGSVKRHLIYRSQGLSDLTEGDLVSLSMLGIKLVCDLRSTRERLSHPSLWPASAPATRLEFDVSEDVRSSRRMVERLGYCLGESEAHSIMTECYAAFPSAMELVIRDIFAQVLKPKMIPVLIHCSAGKDRTGFAVALLLSALGVPRPKIMEDYLCSALVSDAVYAERMVAAAFASMGVALPAEVRRVVASVQSEYLDASFLAIDLNYGSIRGYLYACGLDDLALSSLRNKFVST